MSYRIPNITDAELGLSESDSGTDSDDNVSDWASDFGDALKTKSLFEETVFDRPEEAIAHDKKTHGVDIKEVKEKLGLDVYGLMRLVNVVRKEVSGLSSLGHRLGPWGIVIPARSTSHRRFK